MAVTSKLSKFINSSNIVDDLDTEVVEKISALVCSSYERDAEDRQHLDDLLDKAMNIAQQKIEKKDFPFENSANIKFGIMTQATIELATKLKIALFSDNEIIKTKVVGAAETPRIDPVTNEPIGGVVTNGKEERALRVSTYMNYQLSTGISYWIDDKDKFLMTYGLSGNMYSKSFYCLNRKKIVTVMLPFSDIYLPKECKSLDDSSRITNKYSISTQGFIDNINMGLYSGVELEELCDEESGEYKQEDYTILEQDFYYDMDDDGVPEPYIAYYSEEHDKVLRLVACYDEEDLIDNESGKLGRIERQKRYVHYGMIPSLDGSCYYMGFGALLLHSSSAINTLMNQILDAGKLSNLKGGFYRAGAMRERSGNLRMGMAEFKPVKNIVGDIRQNIMSLDFAPPSPVLFSVLDFLVGYANKLGMLNDMALLDKPANMTGISALQIIESGMTVFRGVYERMHRSLTRELKIIFGLNHKFLTNDEYQRVTDMRGDVKTDFNDKDFDLIPSSDPKTATSPQKMARAQMYMQFMNDPLIDQVKLRERVFELTGATEGKDLIVPPQPQQPQPPTEVERLQAQLTQLQAAKLKADIDKVYSQIKKTDSDINLDSVKAQNDLLRTESDMRIREQDSDAITKKRYAEAVDIMSRSEDREEGGQNREHAKLLDDMSERGEIERKTDVGLQQERAGATAMGSEEPQVNPGGLG